MPKNELSENNFIDLNYEVLAGIESESESESESRLVIDEVYGSDLRDSDLKLKRPRGRPRLRDQDLKVNLSRGRPPSSSLRATEKDIEEVLKGVPEEDVKQCRARILNNYSSRRTRVKKKLNNLYSSWELANELQRNEKLKAEVQRLEDEVNVMHTKIAEICCIICDDKINL